MTAVGEGEKLRAGASMKTLLLLFTKLPKVKKSCFSVHFMSFFCFWFLAYWDNYYKFARFDSHKPLKKYWPSHPKLQIYE